MNTNIIINSVSIPKVGLGTYKLTGYEGIKSIEDALQIGYRHIDTAQVYNNEQETGKAVRNSKIGREKIFITTKVWPSDFNNLLSIVEESLSKLKTDYVDLLLLHWPSDEESNKIGVEYLNAALHKGYTKSVGVSNFNLDQLAIALAQAPIICNQVEYHPFLSQQKMLTYLRQQNMFLTAYSPLALGKVVKDETLQQIAKKYKKTSSQVALRWLIQQGDIAVIPKASSSERRKENLNIFDFELAPNDMMAIFELDKSHRLGNPSWAPKWD